MRPRGIVIAMAAGMLGLGGWAVVASRGLAEAGRELTATAAHVAQMSSELETTRADADMLVDILGVLRADDLRRINLVGQGAAAEASGLVLGGRRGLLLLTENLPEPAAGRAYHVWIQAAGGVPVHTGTFEVNPFGMATVVHTRVAVPRSAAVTVTDEPSGGGIAPTSRPVLAGS